MAELAFVMFLFGLPPAHIEAAGARAVCAMQVRFYSGVFEAICSCTRVNCSNNCVKNNSPIPSEWADACNCP
jgi:hypothetical protein